MTHLPPDIDADGIGESLESLRDGETLLIPHGEWTLAKHTYIGASDAAIIGDGATINGYIAWGKPGDKASNVAIHNLRIIGPPGAKDDSLDALRITAHGVRLSHVSVFGGRDESLDLHDCTGVVDIDDCLVGSNETPGHQYAFRAAGANMVGCQITARRSIVADASGRTPLIGGRDTRFRLANCITRSRGTRGVTLDNSAGGMVYSIEYSNMYPLLTHGVDRPALIFGSFGSDASTAPKWQAHVIANAGAWHHGLFGPERTERERAFIKQAIH